MGPITSLKRQLLPQTETCSPRMHAKIQISSGRSGAVAEERLVSCSTSQSRHSRCYTYPFRGSIFLPPIVLPLRPGLSLWRSLWHCSQRHKIVAYMDTGPWVLSGAFFLYNTPNDTVRSVQEPMLRFLSESNKTATATYNPSSIWAPSWYQLLSLLPYPSGVSVAQGITASRLVTKHTMKESQTKFAETLEILGTKSSAAPVSLF